MEFLQQNAFQSERLNKFSRIQHGFFGRSGGVSVGEFSSLNAAIHSGDNLESVKQNRCRIEKALQAERLVTLKQVHQNQVVYVDYDFAMEPATEGDALITDCAGLAVGVLTADCAPVLYYAQDINWVGAAHAGWGGAFFGVNESLIDALLLQGAKLEHIYVTIGPTISQDSYEVDAQFRTRLINGSSVDAQSCFVAGNREGYFQFDLPGYIMLRLLAKGISNVNNLAIDTYQDEHRYFSYRRSCHQGQKQYYGRQLSAIMLR